jgi:hypothetical protein
MMLALAAAEKRPRDSTGRAEQGGWANARGKSPWRHGRNIDSGSDYANQQGRSAGRDALEAASTADVAIAPPMRAQAACTFEGKLWPSVDREPTVQTL